MEVIIGIQRQLSRDPLGQQQQQQELQSREDSVDSQTHQHRIQHDSTTTTEPCSSSTHASTETLIKSRMSTGLESLVTNKVNKAAIQRHLHHHDRDRFRMRKRSSCAPTLCDDFDPNYDDSEIEPDSDNQRWSWSHLREEFRKKDSEVLFHKYQARLQHTFFMVLLALNIAFNLAAILVFYIDKEPYVFPGPAIMRFCSLAIFIPFFMLTFFNEEWLRPEFSRKIAATVTLIAMICAEHGGALFALSGDRLTYSLERIRPTYYLVITNHVLLPFPSRIHACIATLVVVVIEVALTFYTRISITGCQREYIFRFTVADIMFYILSAVIGFYMTFLLEIANRRAFMDHRQCVESTFKLDYQKEQQEQLLNSCLPGHLIERVRNDIKEVMSRLAKHEVVPPRPFNQLYVEKYKNVSILYADIVNSMLLTASLHPRDLVETLNELFGRFDDYAERNHCMRIKLLGDCYYCVSGVPIYDPNHAENCIEMGLDMIWIIKSVREDRGVNVDMRIGVHTGKILSGLLGLHKWQFDIWSNDALIASQMEHDGVPGHVHCTQTTFDLIPDVKRRQLNIKERRNETGETTYLMTRKIICHDRSPSGLSPATRRRGQTERLKENINKLRRRSSIDSFLSGRRRTLPEHRYRPLRNASTLDPNHELYSTVDNSAISAQPEDDPSSSPSAAVKTIAGNPDSHVLSRQFLQSLKKYRQMITFVNQSMDKAIDKMPFSKKTQWCHPQGIHPFFLCFTEPPETPMIAQLESASPTMNGCLSCLPLSVSRLWSMVKGCIPSFVRQGSSQEIPAPNPAPSPKVTPLFKCCKQERQYMKQADPLFRYYLFCSIALCIGMAAMRLLVPRTRLRPHILALYGAAFFVILFSIIYNYYKKHRIPYLMRVLIWFVISCNLLLCSLMDLFVNEDEISDMENMKLQSKELVKCGFTWYYVYSIILAMTCVSLFIRIHLWLKAFLLLCAVIEYLIACESNQSAYSVLEDLLDDSKHWRWKFLGYDPKIGYLYYIVTVGFVLHIIDRQIEYIFRLDFQWNCRLEAERCEAATMGEINRILLENILPAHVAHRYLYTSSAPVDEIYHESYTSIAVMFASIPNYSSFYSENHLNEEGLKCLQLLNEILCDFDQLLSLPAFKRIEKIKTIGSTYMAASGLQPGRGSTTSETSEEDAAANVIDMVNFATALMETLERINKDALQEFSLRVGIAVGPVIAGVVGASKPQYDIWGDTVNVASRMDSTGVSGKLHVTQEVANILRNCETRFEVESRGLIYVKGKGRLETFFVRTFDQEEEVTHL